MSVFTSADFTFQGKRMLHSFSENKRILPRKTITKGLSPTEIPCNGMLFILLFYLSLLHQNSTEITHIYMRKTKKAGIKLSFFTA